MPRLSERALSTFGRMLAPFQISAEIRAVVNVPANKYATPGPPCYRKCTFRHLARERCCFDLSLTRHSYLTRWPTPTACYRNFLRNLVGNKKYRVLRFWYSFCMGWQRSEPKRFLSISCVRNTIKSRYAEENRILVSYPDMAPFFALRKSSGTRIVQIQPSYIVLSCTANFNFERSPSNLTFSMNFNQISW